MKIILYVFAFVWFLAGLGALIGGPQLGMGALLGGDPSVSAGAVPDAATLGWFWLWTFPMPSLLAGALGAVLGRLDDIREAIEFSNERDDTDDSQPEPEERVAPYIGEGYLATHPDTNFTASKRDQSLS
ncbi:MAG: hypothetical protein WCH04_14940 [Gammaproteobacteria bacterium]